MKKASKETKKASPGKVVKSVKAASPGVKKTTKSKSVKDSGTKKKSADEDEDIDDIPEDFKMDELAFEEDDDEEFFDDGF